MLEAIRSIFRRHPGDVDEGAPDLRLAVCALLIEVADADEEVTADERAVLEHTLEDLFGLDPPAARELYALADEERREAVDVFRFTSVVTRHLDVRHREVLVESMWRVVYADGRLSRRENQHLRKLTRLLDVGPRAMVEARRRAVRSVLQLRTAPVAAPNGSPSRSPGAGRRLREARMDEVLAGTFPASDPPAWTSIREAAERE